MSPSRTGRRCRTGRRSWAGSGLLLGLLAVLASACDGEDSPFQPGTPRPAIDLTQSWQTANPEDEGFVLDQLQNALERARSTDRLTSLLVVRFGRLVAEEYYRGRTQQSLNDVRSITKSVVSTLTGLAIENGILTDLNQPIGELIDPGTTTLSSEQAAITVGQLLTMSGGFQWDEATPSGYNQWVTSPDPIAYLLDPPLAATPGAEFLYNSAAVHLLGVALEDAAGMTLPDMADAWLFGPIGIDTVAWEPLGPGRVNGGSGIDLRSRDLARLGTLMLQDGLSGTMRILPDGWVATATTPSFTWRSTYGPLSAMSYGRLWWTDDAAPSQAFMAWGFGGQFVYVVPALEIVVVATTEWQGVGSSSTSVTHDVLDLVVNGVVASAR